MVVEFNGSEWKIDVGKLPYYKSECSPESEAFNISIHPKWTGCGHDPEVVGSTLSPPRIFFTLWIGGYAKNLQYALFEARDEGPFVRRLLTADGGVGALMISPSGRYLAFAGRWSNGVCHVSSWIEVADLGPNKDSTAPAMMAEVRKPTGSMLAEPLRWTRGDKLIYREASIENDNSCKPNPWQTNSIRMKSLRFR